jgi:hypothetical protein
MSLQIKDLGLWSQYIPETPPDWTSELPPGQQVLFVQRASDGTDWYEFRSKSDSFTNKFLLATTIKETVTGHEIVQGIHRDRTTIAVPAGLRVIEIEDVSPDDPAPWKPYEGRIFDPVALTIGDVWEAPIMSVRDYQFAGQANAEGIIDDQETDDWVATGVVPQKLVDAVKAQNLGTERERRVLLFLRGTTVFPRYHELTPLLAASFGKNKPELLDAFFLAASKR